MRSLSIAALLAFICVGQTATGNTEIRVADWLLTEPIAESQIAEGVEWESDTTRLCSCCGEAPACCGDDCCGNGCCSEVCCGGCCSACSTGCRCCDKNCGLFGRGILTYDPCSKGCKLPSLLLGCFRDTEACFDDFISPMTNPTLFEDPRNVTELRTIFLTHHVPSGLGGGDIQLYALQIRARLTDRLSFIAARDGYIVSRNPLVGDGWADIDLGFKYALYRDAKNQRLLSGGVVYDLPVGTPDALQAGGDGDFHLFLTGGTRFCGCGHWLSAFGGIIPPNEDLTSSFVYWSNHFDYQVRRGWYALMEFNWFHYTDGGSDRLGLTGIEGGDLFNLGSGGVNGNNIVTGAIGGNYKPNQNTEIGLAIEIPLTDRQDVLENRLTADLILRY
ncbi:MAG: hypothetical protein AAGF31_04305 [Planctomycetota bacterium]